MRCHLVYIKGMQSSVKISIFLISVMWKLWHTYSISILRSDIHILISKVVLINIYIQYTGFVWSGAGLLISWEQDTTTLVVGGDSRTVRLWDLKAERRTIELPTTGDSTTVVTAIHSHQAGKLWIFIASKQVFLQH